MWDELDGVARSPLAWGGHQTPGSEQLTGEQSHLCLLHKPSAHGTTLRCLAADSLFGQVHTGPCSAPVLEPSISLLQCLAPRVPGLQLQRAWFGMAGTMGWVCQELGGMGCMRPPQQMGLERFDKVALSLG